MLEKDIAAALSIAAKKSGWKVYPEHEAWDLILVRQNDKKKIIVGIETKLLFSMGAFRQASARGGVHYKIVCAINSKAANGGPWGVNPRKIARWSALYKIVALRAFTTPFWQFVMAVPDRRYRHHPLAEIWLPSIEHDRAAGVPSPHRLSRRAQAELDFERTLREGGGRAAYPALVAVAGRWTDELIARYCSHSPTGRNGCDIILNDWGDLPSHRYGRSLGAAARRYAGKLTEGEAILSIGKTPK